MMNYYNSSCLSQLLRHFTLNNRCSQAQKSGGPFKPLGLIFWALLTATHFLQCHSHCLAKHSPSLHPSSVLPHIWPKHTSWNGQIWRLCLAAWLSKTVLTYTQTERKAMSIIRDLWAGLHRSLSLPYFDLALIPLMTHTLLLFMVVTKFETKKKSKLHSI